MSKNNSRYKLGGLLIALVCFYPCLVKAQITPDATLPNNSQTIIDNKTIIIESGTTKDNNLFHSFEQFSVPTGNTAFFNNAPNIQNIFSRVTGNSVSNVDGLIRANGIANLFLINPNGIIFGPNSRLNIGGSFLGSTANSIVFSDNFEFSAKNPLDAPLLTVSVPIGLRLENPGNIEFKGVGHSLVDSPFFPFRGRNPANSFQVRPGQTLALIGGNLKFSGAILTASGGKIELGSVNEGLVLFNSTDPSWTFDYKEVLGFRNIELASKSLIDTSGFGSGFIQIQGANVNLNNGSIALIQNQGFQSGGSLKVNAIESLNITGVASDRLTISGLNSETLGNGRGADITIFAPQVMIVENGNISTTSYNFGEGGNINLLAQNVNVTNGGVIGTSAASIGEGGNLNISVTGTIEVTGFSSFFPGVFSAIASNTRGSGKGGEINLVAQNLLISNGGSIGTNAISNTGEGGNVTINISGSVKIVGGAGFTTPSALTSSTFSLGNAGTLSLNTSGLVIQDGAVITASTFGNGTAGDIKINASDSIEITSGAIGSSAQKPPESLQQLLNLSPELKGNSGNITINTSDLKIRNGSQVTVRNSGEGAAGTLKINADSLVLNNQSIITAVTALGDGGDIELQAQNLQLLNNSVVTSTAQGNNSNGGNIEIDADTLVALRNSDINADSANSRGGNVIINTQAIFGTQVRDKATFASDITATSGIGINGEIEINTLDFNSKNNLIALQENFINTEQIITSSCLTRRNIQQGSFVVSGAGGYPITPSSRINEWETLTEAQIPSANNIQAQPNASMPNRSDFAAPIPWQLGDPIVEAQQALVTSDGEALLIANASDKINVANPEQLICKK